MGDWVLVKEIITNGKAFMDRDLVLTRGILSIDVQ